MHDTDTNKTVADSFFSATALVHDHILDGSEQARDWARVSLRLQRRAENIQALTVRFHCNYDGPRPAYWGVLGDFLRRLGFEVTPDAFDGGDEMFCPTTQFSAVAMIEASRLYNCRDAESLVSDIEKIWEFIRSADGLPG